MTMSLTTLTAPAALIPARRQTLWRAPAVLNFVLGGMGAGLYLAAVAAAAGGPPGALVAGLGPALVLAGFAAVATEAGRPWRGPRVLRRVRSSWMSREAWLGGAFVAFAGADLAAPGVAWRALAAVAAGGLAVSQGFMLRRARGVTAWDVSLLPPLFLVSALASGAGLLAILMAARGGVDPTVLALLALLNAIGASLWLAYVRWPAGSAFARATAALRAGPLALALVAGGYAAPFVLNVLALAWPATASPAGLAAGALMVTGQGALKWTLVTRIGFLRPIVLPLARRPR
jgi:phenylacetyl-CoA:acceptor oxidoreductase subunit 2